MSGSNRVKHWIISNLSTKCFSTDSKVTYKGEVPDQDVHEDMVHSPPPSAPPLLSEMDYLNGYEDTQFRSGEWIH